MTSYSIPIADPRMTDSTQKTRLVYGPTAPGLPSLAVKANGKWSVVGVSFVTDADTVIDVAPLENKTTRPASLTQEP